MLIVDRMFSVDDGILFLSDVIDSLLRSNYFSFIIAHQNNLEMISQSNNLIFHKLGIFCMEKLWNRLDRFPISMLGYS